MAVNDHIGAELKRGSAMPISGWTIAAVLIALFASLPFFGIASKAIVPSPGLWEHLIFNVLPDALEDTLILLGGVAIISGVTGALLAWLVTAYDFRGRSVIEWALLLPLAVPTYIIAYSYLDILHPIGAVQGVIRSILGYESPREFRLPDIRSMTGCIILLGLVLYPYVYLPVRAMFYTQSSNLVDAARTLGIGRRAIFWRVALPMARPAIAVGVSLALMEALNDIGASEFLGVRTLTVSIYTTWVTRSDLAGASQIALFLLLLVVLLVALEKSARRHARYNSGTQRLAARKPQKVGGLAGFGLFVLSFLPVLFGFVFPALYLVNEAYKRWMDKGVSTRLLSEAFNTLSYATIAMIGTVILGIIVAYASRLKPGTFSGLSFRLSQLGYAAPGTVVAIGALIVFGRLDVSINRLAEEWLGFSLGLVFLGSGGALVLAYMIRFLTISAGSVEAGLSRIPLSLDQASRSLGKTSGETFRAVHLPLTRSAIATAAILIFVDCVKELPMALLLRPLNVETFATHLYGEAARGTYEEAAIVALAIVLIGLLPVIFLSRIGRGKSE